VVIIRELVVFGRETIDTTEEQFLKLYVAEFAGVEVDSLVPSSAWR
jgi:hypothetical protein